MQSNIMINHQDKMHRLRQSQVNAEPYACTKANFAGQVDDHQHKIRQHIDPTAEVTVNTCKHSKTATYSIALLEKAFPLLNQQSDTLGNSLTGH